MCFGLTRFFALSITYMHHYGFEKINTYIEVQVPEVPKFSVNCSWHYHYEYSPLEVPVECNISVVEVKLVVKPENDDSTEIYLSKTG